MPTIVLARLQARLAALDAAAELPAAGIRTPSGTFAVESAMPPEHYEGAVARGVERIRAGALDKVVLAREVQVHAPADHDPAAILGILREGFPSCFVFCVGRGDSAFVAASPELLIRREGMRAHDARAGRLDGAQRRPGRRRRTSASGCCARARTARSTRSSSGASPARCATTRCGWPRARSPSS